MVLVSETKLASILGTVEVTYHTSRKEKIGQQDVHGGVEMVVPPHCTDNAQISSQCQHIDHREE